MQRRYRYHIWHFANMTEPPKSPDVIQETPASADGHFRSAPHTGQPMSIFYGEKGSRQENMEKYLLDFVDTKMFRQPGTKIL